MTTLLLRSEWVPRLQAARARFGRPIRDALVIVGIARALWYFFVQDIRPWEYRGIDTRAYWQVDLAHPYTESSVGGISSFLYSPAFALAMAPFGALPFQVFYGLWLTVSLVILAWLIRPWPWALGILALPIIYELCVGNVNFLVAAVIVLGFRAPSLWALPVLTKVTLGVGLLWFPVRREWRSLAIALGTIAIVVAVSFALYPTAWFDWFVFLSSSSDRSQFLVWRLGGAVALVIWGARTGRCWVVPVAVWFAQPNIIINSWVILLAVIPLMGRDGSRRSRQ